MTIRERLFSINPDENDVACELLTSEDYQFVDYEGRAIRELTDDAEITRPRDEKLRDKFGRQYTGKQGRSTKKDKAAPTHRDRLASLLSREIDTAKEEDSPIPEEGSRADGYRHSRVRDKFDW